MCGTGSSFSSPVFNGHIRKPKPFHRVTVRDGQGDDRSSFRQPAGVTVTRGGAIDSPVGSGERSWPGVTTQRGAASDYFSIDFGSVSGTPNAGVVCSGVPLSDLRATMLPDDNESDTSSQGEIFPVRNLEVDY